MSSNTARALGAIVARIMGNLRHPDLVAFGAVGPSAEQDCLRIANAALVGHPAASSEGASPNIVDRLALSLTKARHQVASYRDEANAHAGIADRLEFQVLDEVLRDVDQILADVESMDGVRLFLDCSVHHLPESIREQLDDRTIEGLTVRRYEYGWWVHVPDDNDDPKAYEGIPQDLRLVLDHARGYGCRWVNFDIDAPLVASLPTYLDESSVDSEPADDSD